MKNDLVDLLESVAYMICKDDDITSDVFYEVSNTSSHGVYGDWCCLDLVIQRSSVQAVGLY